jgi:hypothetical protein
LADNGGACVSFTTTESTDYLTERFTALEPDVANATLTFTPAGGSYVTCRETIEVLPLDVTGATRLSLTDDDSELVSLADGARIPFYGVEYSAFYVNSNGNVTFLAGDTNYQPEFAIHFSVPRIAALFTDLNPSGGGNVYVQQRADRMVVTWLDVPHYDFNGDNQIQLEMHFDGTIRISLLGLRASPSLVGLSNGLGLQSDFTASDLSLSGRCTGMVEDPHSADTNRDGVIQLQELMRVIQFVNLGGYHCDAAGEDGYGAGPGTDQACTPHHSDYNGQDWIVSLTEILRLVQFYNAGGYEAADGTEDGFQAVMAP